MKKSLVVSKIIIFIHIVYLLIIFFFAGTYYMLGLLDEVSTNVNILHFNNCLMGATLTLLTLFLYKKLNNRHWRKMGWYLYSIDSYFLFIVFIVNLAIAILFIFVLQEKQILIATIHFGKFNDLNYLFLMFWALIGWTIAALKEEVLSRGFVLLNISHFKVVSMIIVSAIIFMILHVPTNGMNPYKMISWFLGGVVYAYIYIKSGSILISTATHMIHNYLNDWLLGNNNNFAIIELSQKIAQEDKLLYEILLKLMIFVITLSFYGKNGLFTPSTNLKREWIKKEGKYRETFIAS
jgi:membrane protease YdiL (CAAX protease family)